VKRCAALLATLVALLVAAPAASAVAPTPFGHTCTEQNGVLFCPTSTPADRVQSFDGAPLDVDVTLPAGTQAGKALPTIVLMHGYGGNKTDFESNSEEGKRTEDDRDYHFNNNYYAKQGYAVLNYTTRGFGGSCGDNASASTPECRNHRSYVHLADQRWEVRDTQHLLGLLADQEITQPQKIGVSGISYGGGQSVMLAYLRDRIRTRNSSFVPWTSPDGTPMQIAAAFPRWPWSDLVSSLLPNGRFLDFDPATIGRSRDPIGISLKSYIGGLFASGLASGTYCGEPPRVDGARPEPPLPSLTCDDFSADLTAYNVRIAAGEPYDGDAAAEAIADEIFAHHQGFGLPADRVAPLLLQSGWTDDLFPPSESLRVYNQLRAAGSDTPVSLQFGDIGHPRASNKMDTDRDFNDQGSAFFDVRLKGMPPSSKAPVPGGARVWTQTCPKEAKSEGPITASSYDEVQRGDVSFGSAASHAVTSTGNPNSTEYDPVTNMQDPCKQSSDDSVPGAAVYRGPSASERYLMIGRPTVCADVATTALYGQLDSRLWDVGPDGKQTLVTRGAYRLLPNQQGRIAFQLNGNAWRFAPGHTPKLELVGQDDPYLRKSNGEFGVMVSNLTVDFPARKAACARAAGSASPGGGGDEGPSQGNGGDAGTSAQPPPPAVGLQSPSGVPQQPFACANQRRGTRRADRMRGTQTGDRLLGLGGRDTLWGLAGNDCLFGGSGNDRLSGGPGNDVLSGGSGSDRLRGGPGSDRISGGSGNDVIDVRGGGRDRVSCGSGRDRVRLGPGDRARGC
jgi:hypothetical protein